MARINEPMVALVGSVLSVEQGRDYDTKQPDGTAKCLVVAGGGVTVVKLDREAVQLVGPVEGRDVQWFVRYSAWSMDGGNSGMSVAFVRQLVPQDVDALLGAVAEKVGK